MRIKTLEELKEYILRQLGDPFLDVELSDEMLSDVIRETVQEFSEFAYDGELEQAAIVELDGRGDYRLPDGIQTVIKVYTGIGGMNVGGGDLVPDLWSETMTPGGSGGSGGSGGPNFLAIMQMSEMRAQIDKYMGDDMYFDFSSHRKILRLFEPFRGKALLHYTHEYIPEEVDFIYDQNWIKKMSVARARLLQSTVTGKYDTALVGGSRINYQDMRSLAQEEIERLREDLMNKYTGPAPILVG